MIISNDVWQERVSRLSLFVSSLFMCHVFLFTSCLCPFPFFFLFTCVLFVDSMFLLFFLLLAVFITRLFVPVLLLFLFVPPVFPVLLCFSASLFSFWTNWWMKRGWTGKRTKGGSEKQNNTGNNSTINWNYDRKSGSTALSLFSIKHHNYRDIKMYNGKCVRQLSSILRWIKRSYLILIVFDHMIDRWWM